MAQEVDENIPGSKTIYKASKFGMLVVESDNDDGLLEDALSRHPYVKYFEKDVEFRIDAVDPGSGISYPAPSGNVLSPWMRDVLGMTGSDMPASDLSPTGTPTIVAIIDTGAMVTHPYLKTGILKNTGEYGKTANTDNDSNGVKNDVYGASFTADANGNLVVSGDPSDIGTDHGTHVAGIVKTIRDQAIATEGGVYAGAAQNVVILPIRFINESQVGSTSGAIAALDYAARRGAKVVNCSWGARGEDAFTQALFDAMAEAYTQHDMLITIAAGNAERSGPNNNDTVPYFPSSFNIPSVLSVASVTPEYTAGGKTGGTLFDDPLSDFSNYGANTVHLAAPGGYRDKDGYSEGIYSANARFIDSGGSDYVKKKGTSMATPVVAGVAGVVRAINPTLTSYEVKKLLLDTVARKTYLKNAVSSSGIVNAAAAYAAALDASTTGAKPAVPDKPYLTYNQPVSATSSSGSGGGGGCGALQNVGSVPPGNGLLGGNSLMLFSAIYLFSVFVKSMRRHIKKRRV